MTGLLFEAALEGREEEVRRLVEAGEDPEGGPREPLPPIFAATMRGHAGVVRALLEAGGLVQPWPVDSMGHTTETWAVRGGSVEALEAVVAHCGGEARMQALLLHVDINGDSLINLAAEGGHVAMLAHLVRCARGVLDRPLAAHPRAPRGVPPLVRAGVAGHAGAVAWLLDHGADPREPAGEPPSCAANFCVGAALDEVLRRGLVEHTDAEHEELRAVLAWLDGDHPELRARDAVVRAAAAARLHPGLGALCGDYVCVRGHDPASRRSPVVAAAARGDAETCAELAADSGRADVVDALLTAAERGHGPVIAALVAGGHASTLSRGGDTGRTPLHAAAALGRLGACETLLGLGADPNAEDDHGCTPLCRAAAGGSAAAVRLLVAAGAAVGANNNSFAGTPLLEAVAGGHLEAARALHELGADPQEERTWDGFNAAVVAANCGADEAMVAWLRGTGATKSYFPGDEGGDADEEDDHGDGPGDNFLAGALP